MLEIIKSSIEVKYWAHDRLIEEDLAVELGKYGMPVDGLDGVIASMIEDGLVDRVVTDEDTYLLPGEYLQSEMNGYVNRAMVPFVPAGAENDYMYDNETKTYRDLYDDSDWQDVDLGKQTTANGSDSSDGGITDEDEAADSENK